MTVSAATKVKSKLELGKSGAKKIIAIALSWSLKNFEDQKIKEYVEDALKELTEGPFYDIFDEEIKEFVYKYVSKKNNVLTK